MADDRDGTHIRWSWGRQRWSWCIPKGGSGVLTEILVRLIEDHGGVALTNKWCSA